jgi:predicted amidophosphoribosyltransferase
VSKHLSQYDQYSIYDSQQQDPNFSFLKSSLIQTNRRRIRDSVSYFSVRSWRKQLKPLQIASVRNLKANPSEAALRSIAEEIAECACAITNGRPYNFVCPVPSGTPRKKKNFSHLIARSVANYMNINFCPVLETVSEGGAGSSHPQKSLRFKARLEGERPAGKIGLIVDDVATTGSHFVQCVEQFRRFDVPVVCVSWIG